MDILYFRILLITKTSSELCLLLNQQDVDALTEMLPFLKWPVENYPWFSSLLALLAPLLLVAFISLLPTILLVFVKFEKLIEIESYQHPSLFSKLAIFTILQVSTHYWLLSSYTITNTHFHSPSL